MTRVAPSRRLDQPAGSSRPVAGVDDGALVGGEGLTGLVEVAAGLDVGACVAVGAVGEAEGALVVPRFVG